MISPERALDSESRFHRPTDTGGVMGGIRADGKGAVCLTSFEALFPRGFGAARGSEFPRRTSSTGRPRYGVPPGLFLPAQRGRAAPRGASAADSPDQWIRVDGAAAPGVILEVEVGKELGGVARGAVVTDHLALRDALSS